MNQVAEGLGVPEAIQGRTTLLLFCTTYVRLLKASVPSVGGSVIRKKGGTNVAQL